MIYQFGDFRLDATHRLLLSKSGEALPIASRALDALLFFVQHPGELLDKSALMKAVWPNTIVEENNLNQHISALRKLLGETPESHRFIVTVPGRGYRFVAPVFVERAAADPIAASNALPASAAPTKEASTRPPRQRPPALKLIAGLAVVAVLIGLLAKLWLPQNTPPSRSLATAASETASKISAAKSPVDNTSIAVLPFTDMSERKDQEYFSDGLSEELIDLLGQTPGLRVIARTSSFYFKGKSEKLETIAQELRVANVLEGSVRKDGNRLRVTAQLIRVDTSEHLWSETFDRDLHDVFKVQDEIAAAVVSALKVHLLAGQRPTARDQLGTPSLEAYNQVLLGMQSYNKGEPDGYRHSVVAFRTATELDPGYARAYALLALGHFWVADSTGNGSDYEMATAAADKAVERGPEQAASYATRGFLRAAYFDFSGAQSDLEKAVELGPGDADVLHRSAVVLATLGNLPAAISREQHALALDPLSAEISMRLGFFMAADQQLAQARRLYERSLAIAENSIRANFNLGELELLENRPAQALATFQKNVEEGFRLEGEAEAEYFLGHFGASQQALVRLIARDATRDPESVARVYAWRGEKDQAFAWAERAYARRDPSLTWIKIDTAWRSLRGDPRYQALLREMKLPDN